MKYLLLLALVRSEIINVSLEAEKMSPKTVDPNFVGFSMAWGTANTDGIVKAFLEDPEELVFNKGAFQVMKNFKDASKVAPILRIGGNTAMNRDVTVSDIALKTLRMLADQLDVKFIIGCALSSEPEFIVEFLRRIESIVGLDNIISLEIGNEPDHLVKQGRRQAPYTYEMFLKEMEITVDAIKGNTGFRTFEGPAYAGCNTFLGKECWEKTWLDFSRRFPDHKYISFHRYGASGCSEKTNELTLLEDPQPTGPRSFEYIEELRRELPADKEVVWGEGNTLSCGSLTHDVSMTFGATLWAVDSLFEASVAGVAHANFHGIPFNKYTPFYRLDGGVEIRPVYYGMLFVNKMIDGPGKITFKPTYQTSNPVFFKVWGIYDTLQEGMRIVAVNKDLVKQDTMKLVIDVAGRNFTKATLSKLTAPDVNAKTGIQYDGQTFEGTLNGLFKGMSQGPLNINGTETVNIVGGKLEIDVPPLSVLGIIFL